MTNNYTFTDYTITHSRVSEGTSSYSSDIADLTIASDADKSYDVTANVFSASVETYNASVGTSSTIGPLNFDCYTVNTAATVTNFNNSLTLNQSDGQSLPSWLSFDATSVNIAVSSPTSAGSDNYKIANNYTGVLGSFTLDTELTISVVGGSTNNNTNNNSNNDEDHCLNASSEALCGVYVAIIVVVPLIVIIAIGALVYCKFKKRSQEDLSRVNEDDNDVPNIEDEANRSNTDRQDQVQDAELLDSNKNEDQSNLV